MADIRDVEPLHEPNAELEQTLIDEYIRATGQQPDAVRSRHDEASRALLAAASSYATARLAEVETRAHYVRSLRGEI